MTNTCRHDFQFCYKGNRGIALRCSRCGKPEEFRKRFCIWRWLMFCIVTLLYYVEFMSREPLPRLLSLGAIILLLLFGFPTFHALIFRRNIRLQDKYLLPCSGTTDD